MSKYIIHRDIPGVGSFSPDEYRAAAQKSNEVIAAMQAEHKAIQWVHSYATADVMFCIYIVEEEALIYEHSERSGFPANIVRKVTHVVDPVTAEGE